MLDVSFFELGSAFDDLAKIFIALDLVIDDDEEFNRVKNDIVNMCMNGIDKEPTPEKVNMRYAKNIRSVIDEYKRFILDNLDKYTNDNVNYFNGLN